MLSAEGKRSDGRRGAKGERRGPGDQVGRLTGLTKETQDVVAAGGASGVGLGVGGIVARRITLTARAVLSCRTGLLSPLVCANSRRGTGHSCFSDWDLIAEARVTVVQKGGW